LFKIQYLTNIGKTFDSKPVNLSRFFSRCFWCISACSCMGDVSKRVNIDIKRRIQSLLLANTKVRPGNWIRK